MKTKNLFVIVIVIAAIVIIFYSFIGGEASYAEEILKDRREKDEYMRKSDESPFKGKKDFAGLKYFETDPQYKIVADLTPIQQRKAVILGTSDGKEQHYLEYAHADFKLHGKAQRLLILEIMEEGATQGSLFLAFGDETSADETYGAGRYLDVSRSEGSNTITLDFNKAYNPYCAYNDSFSCPFPPRENLMTVAIRAGEKNYKP